LGHHRTSGRSVWRWLFGSLGSSRRGCRTRGCSGGGRRSPRCWPHGLGWSRCRPSDRRRSLLNGAIGSRPCLTNKRTGSFDRHLLVARSRVGSRSGNCRACFIFDRLSNRGRLAPCGTRGICRGHFANALRSCDGRIPDVSPSLALGRASDIGRALCNRS
jgi:hypothetical protein